MRTTALSLSLSIFCLASPGLGQPEPADDPPPPPREAVRDQAAPDPELPQVTDQMLEAVPPTPNRVDSWRDAVRMVRARSTNLRLAATQIEQANAQVRQALAGTMPSLTASANIQTHLLRSRGTSFSGAGLRQNVVIPDPPTTYGAGLALRWPVFVPGVWHDRKTAKRSVRAAQLSKKDSERLVLAGLANSIVTQVTAERLAEVSRVSLRSALSTLDLTRRRARLGASSAFDVIRAEQEAALSRAQVVSANETVRQSREALGLALGDSKAWMVTPNIRIDTLARDAQSVCQPEPSVSTRPDILAAKANVEIAKRNSSSVDWTYVPTVSVVSDLNYFPVTRTQNNLDFVWTVGAVLSWNLYDGGLRYGQREARESEVRTANEQLTEARRQAEVEVTQARRGVEVARATLDVSKRSRDLAKESARLSRIAFVNGTGTSFDLVDAARRLREAEIDLAIKEFEVVQAQITALLALATCDV